MTVFDPTSGRYLKQQGGQLVALTEDEVLGTRESAPSIVRQRNTKDAILQYETNLSLLQNQSRDMASELDAAGYDIKKTDYKNLVSDKTLPEAFVNLANEREQIVAFIGQVSDPAKRERLQTQYQAFTDQALRLDQAQNELTRWQQAAPFRKGEGIDLTPRQPEDSTVLEMQSIIDSGPQGEFSTDYYNLDFKIRTEMGMPISVFITRLRNDNLTPTQQKQWQQILFEIEDSKGQ